MPDKLELFRDGQDTYTIRITDAGKPIIHQERVSFKKALKLIRQYEKENRFNEQRMD